jgi:Acetyltransferase (GNAT) domain
MPFILIDTPKYFTTITTIHEDPDLVQKAIAKRSSVFHSAFFIDSEAMPDDGDFFDKHYQHLLVIEKESNEVVGGYRFIHTEEALKRFGLDGFYTHTIFNYTEDFLDYIGQSFELGGMFICEKYQKNGIVLNLLWASIAKHLTENTHLQYCFGALSLPSNIDLNALIWIAIFCKTHYVNGDIEQKVQARYPAHVQLLDNNSPPSLNNLEIDLNCKKLLRLTTPAASYTNFRQLNLAFQTHFQKKYPFPTLLRNYEKLNVQFSVFGKDPSIFNTTDIFVSTRSCNFSRFSKVFP